MRDRPAGSGETSAIAIARSDPVDFTSAASFLIVPFLCCAGYSASKGNPAALTAYAGALCALAAYSALAARGEKETSAAAALRKSFSPWRVCAAVSSALLFCFAAWGFGFWTVAVSGHAWNAPAPRVISAAILSALTMISGVIGAAAGAAALAAIEVKLPAFCRGISRLLAALTGAVIGCSAGLLFPF
jgi:hypothetical protein